MAELLRIFVSATRDLEAARAVIGQTLAALPVQIGAEIRRTPVEGTSYESLFELISNVDRVYFLMGRDITAPSGAEWLLSWQLERNVLPLKLANSRTLAAQEFLRLAPVEWISFADRNHLAALIGLDLIDLLLHPKNRYGLSPTELDSIRMRRAQIKEGLVVAAAEAGGAEGGGVILDPGRVLSTEGVLLEE